MLKRHQEFLEKIRFRGKGSPQKATAIKRGTDAIRVINEVLRNPSHDLGLFVLEIIKCIYVYEPMLGIPRYSLDKALVSLCSKIFVKEIYSEIEKRIKLHLGRILSKQMNSIDECMSHLDYNDPLLDEIVAGYLMIRYKAYGEYRGETCEIMERVGPRIRARARKIFGSLMDECGGACLMKTRIKEILARRNGMLVNIKKERLSHEPTKDEIEYIRENYPLVSCFYDIPESIGVPYIHLRRNFSIDYFIGICNWNGFAENTRIFSEIPREKALENTTFLRDLCFQMCRNREYHPELMQELIRRSTSFERAFMEGYVRLSSQEYKEGKEKLRMVLEIVREMEMRNIPEVLLWVYDLISMSHMFCGEYFECIFYLNKGIELSYKHQLDFIARYFLNCKLVVERIGCIPGPSPDINLELQKTIDTRYIIENEKKTIGNRILTNLALKNEMSNLREIRTLERFVQFKPSTLCGDIQRILKRFEKFTVVSLYCIDGCLFINDFKGFVKIDGGFRDVKARISRILIESRNILKENVHNDVDKARWWMQRIELDTKLGEVLHSVSTKFDGLFTRKDIILVLDETTTEFPFESMPIFRGKAVYRVPSLEYLEETSGANISGSSFFYLLDPENNLPKTQDRMTKFLKSFGITNGVTGRSLSDLECREADKCDILLYFGHGSGLKYLKISGEGKIMLLFGCSSAKLLCIENYKRNGAILKHLRKNSTVVGCLWEVTDKDIDNFSIKIIEGLVNGCSNLGELVSRYRNEFRLRYLNGASVVIYGVH
ncbi:separase [Encephalitozoon romaleae SJ-2008]|uniref:separase n=1 Tax=Encephalitozoon romaleae (strain SJ-2008) TaxID=1178016 RepID=I7ANE0_ENCRO|nr:separase [Encephalitozoon romaleae SJ-2008]AFN83279.1 separase [Encephalitozoon romaleae SJ-2008]